jgi:alpha-N-arabinofuranosidase
MWGPWQVGQMTSADYSKTAAQWAKALKLLDPTLCLILCGETGHASWDHEVLKECIPFVDMHSIHIYTSSNDHLPNVIAPLSAERAIETAAALIDIARIEKKIPPSVPRTTICFDEWNVWDPVRAPGEQGAEELYTLSDALGVAVWLNVFVRQSKFVGMANIAQSVNVISPLMTTKDGVVKQATWWPLLLFSKYMRGWTVSVHVNCGAYDGVTQPAWLQGVLDQGASWLDVSASINEEGVLTLVVVNISETTDFEVELSGAGNDVEVFEVNGATIKAVNAEGKEEVSVKNSKWDGSGKYTFPKHSMTMLRWSTGKKITEVKKGDGLRLDTRKLAWE